MHFFCQVWEEFSSPVSSVGAISRSRPFPRLTFVEKRSIIEISIDIDSREKVNIMQGHIPRTLAERIVCDENILTGKPVIKGTRLAVEFNRRLTRTRLD